MTERGRRRLPAVLAQVFAPIVAVPFVMHAGWPWPVLVPAAFFVGTLGWFVGTGLGHALARWLRRVSYAPPGRAVYPLLTLPPQEGAEAGGKGRSLARLRQAGHPVPDGFVVLARAFGGATGDALSDEAAREVDAALRKLTRRHADATFAVRSSGLVEDSAAASYAGAFETELRVPADEVDSAVVRVRRSRHAARVGAYAAAVGEPSGDTSVPSGRASPTSATNLAGPAEARRDTGSSSVPASPSASTGSGQPGERAEPSAPDAAVVVQRMIEPEHAGVLFTANPLTGDLRTMVGNVVAGVGESLVAGDVSAPEFTFDRPDGRYEGPDGLRPVARRLHTEAHAVENTFDGAVQDIEWASIGTRVWILQARPVTTMTGRNPRTAERNDSLAGACLWSATNLTEANPEPQTPLTISLKTYLQDHGGPSIKVKGREMAGYIGGRPYANLSVQISAQGPKADPRAAYARLEPVWGRLPSGIPIPTLPVSKADWKTEGTRLLGAVVTLTRHKRDIPAFLATNPDRCRGARGRIAACATPAQLLTAWETEIRPGSLRAFWAVIAATGQDQADVETELTALIGPDGAAALAGNLRGLAGGGLVSLGPALGLAEVQAGRLTREEYLERFGHRGYNEVELAWPRPSEDPGWLDEALSSATTAAGAPTAAGGAGVDRERAYDEALARLRDEHPRAARGLLRRLRRRARAAATREAVRSEAVRWTGVERAFALRAGELLGLGDDVFLLTADELFAALGGAEPRVDLGARRAAYERSRSLPPLPGFIVGPIDPFAWTADPGRRTDVFVAPGLGAGSPDAEPTPTEAVITGVPGALGVVEGVVRRLDRLDDQARLLPGEVLVTRLTNIGWTPVFPRAAAIVTDLGAPLSHAAIVARELGVPAVVGCGDATARLRTGDRVRIDGAHGTVELLPPERP